MRKAISYIIIVSMVLHCASRIGVISYVYSKRHDIAFSLGITAERVIATCSSDYQNDRTLFIASDSHTALPSALPIAQEIILFLVNGVSPLKPSFYFSNSSEGSVYESVMYDPPVSDIFHPPLV